MKIIKSAKPLPRFKSDKEAEEFVTNSDLTQFDLSEFTPVHFDFSNKTTRINMRLPESLLEQLKLMARKRKIPYSRFIRQILEAAIGKERR